jgi:hypothetical protein
MKLDPEKIAEAIGIPLATWPGNCYGIACAVVEAGLVDGTAVYGHWLGPVAPSGHFGARSGHAFVQHGWIVTPDDEVIDPTRWVFEDVAPYIFVGYKEDDALTPCRHCGHIGDEHSSGFLNECEVEGCDCPDFAPEPWPYDEGGNSMREWLRTPPPEPDDDERKYELALGDGALKRAQRLLQDESRVFTVKQVHWLATESYERLQPFAAEIYAAYKAHEHLEAFIPIDNRLRAEREKGQR